MFFFKKIILPLKLNLIFKILSYLFPVGKWLSVDEEARDFKCAEKKENNVSKMRTLENVKYEIIVVTGNEKGAGTGECTLNEI
jgi:hypothetical protein